MSIKHIYYRGSLKSCNYSCYYCPFAKHKMTNSELEKDKMAFDRFSEKIKTDSTHDLTVMITPYGEAMIHEYYQNGLIDLAKLQHIKGVGIQTNLSFSTEIFIEKINQAQINKKKLKIWASYHPSMVDAEVFAAKANRLEQYVDISVGMVAVPEDLESISELKKHLSPSIYLWLNGQSRRKSHYTEQAKCLLKQIDPFFDFELNRIGNETALCTAAKESILVEANGKIFPCHMINTYIGNYYKEMPAGDSFICDRSYCDCFLSYSQLNLNSFDNFFGANKRFRIPEKKSIDAIFFDIDGTLTDKYGKLTAEVKETIIYLASKCKLYLATSLPFEKARQKIKSIWPYFQGGIFSNGSYIWEKSAGEIKIFPIAENCLSNIESKTNKFGVDRDKAGNLLRIILPYNYKITQMPETKISADGNKIYIQSTSVSKKQALALFLDYMQIQKDNVLAVGNSENDREILLYSGFSMKVLDSSDELADIADYSMEIVHIPYIVK